MRKYITLLTIVLNIFIFSSCAPKIVSVKNQYAEKNFESTSDNPKDKVWDNIIEFFAKRGLSIRIIDRSSGLIISNEMLLPTTHENPKGGLYNPSAWAVADKIYPPGSDTKKGANFYIIPFSGEWNIRIKDAPNNKTLVNVNLIIPTQKPYLIGKMPINPGNAGTTGVFEKMIFDAIK